jgi:hypothetical protein
MGDCIRRPCTGSVTLISVNEKTTSPLYPSASLRQRLDAKTYEACPGPIDPEEKDKFRAHGLFLRPGRNAVHTLYVVHHGNRESIEVFEFDARSKAPALTWVGCAVAPEPIGLNGVVALPEGVTRDQDRSIRTRRRCRISSPIPTTIHSTSPRRDSARERAVGWIGASRPRGPLSTAVIPVPQTIWRITSTRPGEAGPCRPVCPSNSPFR